MISRINGFLAYTFILIVLSSCSLFRGSKISKDIELKNAFAATLSEVYMFANQLPLLGVGRVAIGSKSEIELRDCLYCAVVLY